jgi:predicted RND superfamily exporter protein
MVSIDSKSALVSAQFREDEDLDFKKIFQQVRQLCNAISDANTDVSVAGETMIRGYIYSFLGQTKCIFIVTVFAVLLLLFLYTRKLQMVVMPSISACVSAVWGLGFVGILGYDLDPLVLVVPLLITARTISHSVQFNERFIEEYEKNNDIKESTKATIIALFYPGLAGIITDALGIAVLAIIPIPFLQKLGVISAFWAFSTVFTVLLLNPLILIFLPPFSKKNQTKQGFFEKILVKISLFYTKKSSWIVIFVTVVLSIVAIIYQKELKVGDANPGSPLLWPDSQYNIDAKSINESFPGLDPLLVVLEGKEEKTMYNHHILSVLEKYQYYMQQLPTVGGSLSMADLVKKINMKLHEDHPKFEVIPPTRNEIGTLNYMLMQGSDRGDLDAFTTFDDKTGSVIIYFKNHLGDTIREAITATKEFIKDNPVKGAQFKMAGGVIGTLAAANEEIFKSQIKLLIMTFGLTIIFCALAFRSIVAAVLLAIPLAVSNYMVFAYMGLNHLGLNMNTLPVATIAIGIGVDYGIYFLSRVREEYPLTENLQKALTTTLITTGKAITFTALTVALGVVFWAFSSIRFQADMGLLLTIVTFFHLIGTLILLAALILVIKPKCITVNSLKRR